jgi:hypothetical protein
VYAPGPEPPSTVIPTCVANSSADGDAEKAAMLPVSRGSASSQHGSRSCGACRGTTSASRPLLPKLTASDGAANDRFGVRVAVSRDRILIGAHIGNSTFSDSGAAYVYRWNGSSWVEEQKLVASDPRYLDKFGSSVALAGDLAVVGAEYASGLAESDGAVYVFRWNGTSWAQEQKLIASDGAAAEFGWTLDAETDRIIVGAAFSGDGSGAAYLFAWDGSSWVEEQRLSPLRDDQGGQWAFGISVGISDDTAVVAETGAPAYGVQYAGTVHVFGAAGTLWTEEHELTAPDAETDDAFGWSAGAARGGAISEQAAQGNRRRRRSRAGGQPGGGRRPDHLREGAPVCALRCSDGDSRWRRGVPRARRHGHEPAGLLRREPVLALTRMAQGLRPSESSQALALTL